MHCLDVFESLLFWQTWKTDQQISGYSCWDTDLRVGMGVMVTDKNLVKMT